MNVWDTSHWTAAQDAGSPAAPGVPTDGLARAGEAAAEMAREATAFMGRRLGSYANACEAMSRARNPAELVQIHQNWMRACFSDYTALFGRAGEMLHSTAPGRPDAAPAQASSEGAPVR